MTILANWPDSIRLYQQAFAPSQVTPLSKISKIASKTTPSHIYIGIGGWTFEPWRGVFYPEKLSQKKELGFASSKLTSIEINRTYYSTFKPSSWIKWTEGKPSAFLLSLQWFPPRNQPTILDSVRDACGCS